MEAIILILPLLLLGWLFLTSSRRQKQMRTFASSLNIGDQIVTSSGLFGTIRHLDDTTAWLEVAEGVTLRVDRRAIAMKQADTAGPTSVTGPSHSDEADQLADDTNGEGTSGNRAAGQ